MTHKYHAVATEVDGIRFASKKEARRYGELKLLEKAGEISQLILQPKFELGVVDTSAQLHVVTSGDNSWACIGEYRADFQYIDRRTKRWVVEDVKGFKTPLYRWKKKHVEAQYNITIREI